MTSGAAQPVRVRLGLHLVPDAGQEAAATAGPEPGQLIADGARGQVSPADDARHQRLGGCQGEQFRCLGGDRHCLDNDCGGDTSRLRGGPQVVDGEAAADGRHLGSADPVLIANVKVPDMVVRVDEAHSCQTTGSAALAPCAE